MESRRPGIWSLRRTAWFTASISRPGAVYLIVGTQATKVEETGDQKNSATTTNHVNFWPAETNKAFGDLVFTMKTNWRDGKLYFVFQVAPYSDRLDSAYGNAASSAQFFIRLYDKDGFEMITVPVLLSEMVQIHGDEGKGKISNLIVNTTTACSLEMYEALDSWAVGWRGF